MKVSMLSGLKGVVGLLDRIAPNRTEGKGYAVVSMNDEDSLERGMHQQDYWMGLLDRTEWKVSTKVSTCLQSAARCRQL